MSDTKLYKKIIILLVFGALILLGFWYLASQNNSESVAGVSVESGDTQIIEITVRGGYSPSTISAKTGVETIIKFKTNNTYDCSSSIIIPKLGIREFLPPMGEKLFTVPKEKATDSLSGSCSMGHYRFTINFV